MRTLAWHEQALEHARQLLAAVQDIEQRHDAGTITDEQASAERVEAMQAHFAAMETLNAGDA